MRGIILFLCAAMLLSSCCGSGQRVPDSGVKKATVQVSTQASGLTIEQENIKNRIIEDNKPGSIKHLYVISAYSGQVLLYSTVRGKVTSGGKRLSRMIERSDGCESAVAVDAIQDDGTFGQSDPYIYWWDSRGIYHQHYVSGGQIVHVSSQPLAVKGVIINLESRD